MLDELQIAAVERILNEPTKAALIASVTGAGKTRTALTAAQRLNARTVLVVAPGDTFQNPLDGWQSEVEVSMPQLFHKQYMIDSKNLDNFQRLKNGEPGVYYVTRTWFVLASVEGFRMVPDPTDPRGKRKIKEVFREPVLNWSETKNTLDVAIVDEVHAYSNRNSLGPIALKQLQPKMLKLAMSATPGGDRFEGLWAPTRWLWPNTINPDTQDLYVDSSFWRWASMWGTMQKANHPNATRHSMRVVGERNPGAFTASLPCYIRDQPPNVKVSVNPWFEVPLPMTEKQFQQYKEMEKKSIIWLEENPLVAELPVVQKLRLRQICLGEVNFNEDGEVDFPDDTSSSKIDAAIKIATERHPNEKIVMYVGDSQKFATVAAKRLRKEGIKAEAWSGRTTKKRRQELKDDFVRGDLRVLVASVTSISDGVDGLQTVCNVEVWFNKSLYGIKNEQAEGRLNRRGQHKDHIVRYELVIPKTADEDSFALDAKKFLSRTKELG